MMAFNSYPALSGAVHYLESRNGTAPGIYGDGGLAAGPMQVHQAALTDVNRAYGWNYSHQQLADDPAVGKKVGDAYLALMRQKYGRDDYALGAYNAGPGAMDRAISSGQGLAALPAGAQRYVREGLDRLGAAPPEGALATAPTNTSSTPMPSPFSSQYPNAADLLQVPEETPYVRDQSTPWLALGAGLLSSADPREAMSAGAAGLAKAQGQANKDEQAARQAAQDRAIRLAQAKATLGSADIARRIQMDQFGIQMGQKDRQFDAQLAQQAAQNDLAERRLLISQQQADAATARADAQFSKLNDPKGVLSSQVVQLPNGMMGVMQTFRDGTVRTVDANGKTVEDANGAQRPQDTGAGVGAGAIARQNVKVSDEVFDAAEAARRGRESTAQIRAVIQENPNLVGPTWRAQAGRFIAQRLGLPVDGKTTEALDALANGSATLEQQEIIRMAPALRPLSNTDVPTILRAVPGVMSSPENFNAWLDKLDRGYARADRRAAALQKIVSGEVKPPGNNYRAYLDQLDAEEDAKDRAGSSAPVPQGRSQIEPNKDGGWSTVKSGNGSVKYRVVQ